MNPARSILDPLKRTASAARVRALLRQLDAAKPAAADALITAVARGSLTPEARTDAAEGLFRRWDRLEEVQRAKLMRVGPTRWTAALARLERDEDPAVRGAAASLAEKWPVPEAVRAAARLLTDPSPVVADQAERSLIAAANSAEPSVLDEVYADLAARYPEHRRRAILRAALTLAENGAPRIRAWLREGGEDQMMPLRAVLKENASVSRAQAVRLLAEPALAPAAAARLASPASAEEHESTLALAPLLMARDRSRALRRLPNPLALIPAQDDLERLSETTRLGALWWADLAPAPSAARVAVIATMLADPEPAIRCAAVRRLGALAEAGAPAIEALESAAFDADPRVACAALRELDRAEPSSAARLARHLSASPSGAIRRAAQRTRPAADAWELVAAADARGWRALRAQHQSDPESVLADLRRRGAESDAPARTLAVHAARRLGVTLEIENTLLRALQAEDARLAASAASALGENDTAAARAALSSALAHPDPRVRANALEAIARRDPDEPVVRAWVANEIPRARGNAVRARVVLARDDNATGQLDRMLRDPSPGHRLSGLWVAERAAAVDLSERVAEIAREEAEPQVRERARRCARRLLAEMRRQDPRPASPLSPA